MKKLFSILLAVALISATAMLASCDNTTDDNGKVSTSEETNAPADSTSAADDAEPAGSSSADEDAEPAGSSEAA